MTNMSEIKALKKDVGGSLLYKEAAKLAKANSAKIGIRAVMLDPLKNGLPPLPKHTGGKVPDDILDIALIWIANGVPLLETAAQCGVSYATLSRNLRQRRSEEYAEAKRMMCNALAQHALRLSMTPCIVEEVTEVEDPRGGITRTVKKADSVFARKLAIQTIADMIGYWSPDIYGKKVAVDVQGSMAAAIVAAKERISAVDAEDAVEAKPEPPAEEEEKPLF